MLAFASRLPFTAYLVHLGTALHAHSC